jgi:hypothetical protein
MNEAGYRRPVAAVLLVLAGCASTPYIASDESNWESNALPGSPEVHRVYLLGDPGAMDSSRVVPVVFNAVAASAAQAPESRTLVLLGDIVYCCGLPDSASAGRANAQRKLDKVLDLAERFGGRSIFVPGNHDWNNSRAGGAEYLRRMERYVEARLDSNAFMPSGGLPGPDVIELADDIVLIAIDTEWWLTRQERPYGEIGDYEIDEDLDFAVALNDALDRHEGERVLLVGHHPVYSLGSHNGRFPPRVHLFPLTRKHPNAYVPLPVLGSLYVLGSRLYGGRQDLPNPRYRQLRSIIEGAGLHSESVIYAAGHDHGLQYFRIGPDHNPRHYLVSGAASAPTYVGGGGDATFTSSGLGYATLHYYDDGAIWASFWSVDEAGEESLAFRTRLQEGRERAVESAVAESAVNYRDSVRTTAINPDYEAGRLKSAVLGSHNRDLWGIPVTAPMLDLGNVSGGLTPVKRGGGMQTISLRLEGADGLKYDLRSLDKDPSQSIPAALRGTVALDIVQDQISSINPYGAFAIPPLAKALGLLHTEPQLVFVPDDPRLGPYRETFANQLMMLEHRPDDDMSAFDNLGNSEKVVSAAKLYEELLDDNDNRIDITAFLRTRLLDMLLSDWDRHRGQFRWARFDDPDGKGDIYVPIARDRDWAFNRFNGLVSVLSPLFDPKFQSFNPDFGNIRGLTTNGLEQDRRFLAEVTEDEWVAQAEWIRERITGQVIEEAIRRMPPAIREVEGPRIRSNLQTRLAQLPNVARRYYSIMARIVDVVGTDKHELFVVDRADDGSVTVVVSKTTKEGEVAGHLFERTFDPADTKQIRLFGLGGRDAFVVDGKAERSIDVIAIGGPGQDTFADSTRVASGGRNTRFIDTERGSTVVPGPDTRVTITNDPYLNTYHSRDYRHNVVLPKVYFSSNKDDGVFLGGGTIITRHGFRKDPFASQHRLLANVAPRTLAFNVRYSGAWTDVLGSRDLLFDLDVLTPNNIRNFYGLGNERDSTIPDREYYQARLSRVEVAPSVGYALGNALRVRVGPYVQYTKIREDSARFVAQDPGVSENTFDDQWFGGVDLEAEVDAVDHGANPRQGARWENTATLRYGLANSSDTFARFASDLAFYLSPSLNPQFTLALRAGAAHNVGDFPFYEANTLGGTTNLRGYRSTRFAGRTNAYQNSEVRFKLLQVSSYVAQGTLGLLGFFDVGRVWTDGEDSNVWHTGYGGGVWLNVFRDVTLVASYGFSEDDEAFMFTMGFQY